MKEEQMVKALEHTIESLRGVNSCLAETINIIKKKTEQDDKILKLLIELKERETGKEDTSKCDSCINGGDECEFNPDNFPLIRWCDNYVKE